MPQERMTAPMILIGIGANLPSPRFGSPLQTCRAAVEALGREGLTVTARSRWFRSAPVPISDQPWFVNGVVAIDSELEPAALLERLHRIEAGFGRVRSEPNAPRVLDLDLLDYRGVVTDSGPPPVLPHPRMTERAFVLLPLHDIAPDWRDPRSGEPLDVLIARLPADQVAEPVPDF